MEEKSKFFRKNAVISILAIEMLAIIIIMVSSRIQDMTLATDSLISFDKGWEVTYGDGHTDVPSGLPYFGSCKANETIIAKNTISADMCGLTMSFLSADKTVQIFVDDEMIYSFGMEDQRMIGHTPGSVMVFADIPADSQGKTVSIVTSSPYEDYAAYLTNIVAGDRDIVILNFVKTKIFNLIIAIGILVCGIVILIFGIFYHRTLKSSRGLYSMGIFMLIMFAYHVIETKLLMIFFGNQFLYSNLIFFCLFSAPLFLENYVYENTQKYHKPVKIVFILSGINIIGQLALQCLNIIDFLDMASVSHGLLTIAMLFACLYEFEKMEASREINLSLIGIGMMGAGSALDLVRCYTVKVGDLGKYGRIGVFIFGLCFIIDSLKSMAKYQIQMAEKEKLEIFSGEVIKTLVTAIDAKDIYTRGHSARVSEYSVILAKELGFDEERLTKLRMMALLHDVGKIGIPDRILNKADRLTKEEFEIIKSHTTLGAEILEGVSSLSNMGFVSKSHHERFDGKGYPEGIAGEAIPFEARIVGIVDAYDAMASDRSYRRALQKNVIRNEIVKCSGSQFDPNIAKVFLELFDQGAFDNYKTDTSLHNEETDAYNALRNLLTINAQPGSTKITSDNMSNIYSYIDGIHSRFGIEYHTLLISLTWEEGVLMADVDLAMEALEYSITQSLRRVDLMTRVSESQYLVVLTEAHEQNLKMIIERVFATFFKNCLNTKIKPVYEIK